MSNQPSISKESAERAQRKLLTVCVAAYNGEDTLSKALDSCLIENAEQLEVIVVDDGSTDQTAFLAEKYIAMQPETFRLIRQPNGGYGSAVMSGLNHAEGKYFRTLDCDDWFDKTALVKLLQYLKTCSTDIVFTNYCTVQGDQVQRVFEVCGEYQTETTYTFDMLAQHELDMEIHGMTCRTEMLRASGMQLPLHCSYTDMAYTFVALAAAQTISFLPVRLYQYRLGRDGQSVSIENYQKHFDDYALVTEQILKIADNLSPDQKGEILLNRAKNIAQYGIELLLLFTSGKDVHARLETYDRNLRTAHSDIAKRMHNKNTRLLRLSRYALYGLLNQYAKSKKRG